MTALKPLLISLKDTVAKDLDNRHISDAFRQIELWSQSGLPPPTKSSTTVSFTDPSGVVWVAKAGVHGGQWRQARDVLHARINRVAAFNTTATPGLFGWDSTVTDLYGLLPSTAGFVVPVAGFYRVMFQIATTPTATGQYIVTQLGGNSALSAATHASVVAGLYGRVEDTRLIPVNGSFNVTVSSNATLTGIPGGCAGTISYLGSG